MSSDHGEAIERWMNPLVFGVFLAIALFVCFPSVLLGTESFFFRDYGVLGYPNIHFQRECFRSGELPMWNPYSNCGQPFLAQWGTMALYPLSLIYLLGPLPWGLSLFCFLHLWLGGFGMYLLVRHWTKTNFGAALAGTLFVFNGVTFASFIWPNYLVTLGWMPFVVLLAGRAWREGGRLIVVAALVATLQMLSGAPEVILFTWLIVGALWLCDLAHAPSSAMSLFWRIACVVLLTTGLMAAQLLPFFDLLQLSHRDTGFATSKWQLPLWGWADFVVPMFNAFETPQGQYFQYGQEFLSSVYLGGVGLIFAIVGVTRWPDVRLWVLLALTAFGVVLAFGDQTPVYRAVRNVIPLVGVGRYPVKFLFLAAFLVPLMAGCGLAAVIQSRQRGLVYGMAVLIFVVMLTIAWAAREHRFVDYSHWPENFRVNVNYSWEKTSPGKLLPDAIANTAWRLGFLIAVITGVVMTLRAKLLALPLGVASLALIVADVYFHTPNQNPTLPARWLAWNAWPESKPMPRHGTSRVFITPQAEEFLTFVSSTNAQRIWELKRRAEWSNLNLLDRVPKVNGSSTLQIREQRLLEQALYSMTNRLPVGLLDFLGVAFVSSSSSSNEWAARNTSLPLVTAGQQPVFANEVEAFEGLTNSAFDPRRSVYLPIQARAMVAASNTVPVNLSFSSVTLHSVEFEVDAPAATVVVIAQSFYPVWRATVDGESVPLLRANGAFQALAIPAGKHRVSVNYSDAKFRAGAAVSVAFFLVCGLVWLRAGRLKAA